MSAPARTRFREIAPGVALVLGVTIIVCGAIYGWRLLPGLLGEWVGVMVGVMTTPFVLEFSFLFLGLVLVVAINQWRRNREGDDFVVLEQVDEKEATLPEHASWAIYREEPLPGEEPGPLARAEGALALGDPDAAAAFLSELSADELGEPDALRFRIELANASGRTGLAEELQRQLDREESRPAP